MKERLAWPDVARGISIIGVVVLHATLTVPNGSETRVDLFNTLLGPIRMPLFFMISGYFALKVVRMSFVEVLFKRIWFIAVPYLCWAPVELFLKQKEISWATGRDMPERDFYTDAVFYGQCLYWFLHALVLFTLVLWATKKLSRSWQLGFAALIILAPGVLGISRVAELMPHTSAMVTDPSLPFTAKYFFYLPSFLLGAYLKPSITRFAEHALRPLGFSLSVAALWAAVQVGNMKGSVGALEPSLSTLQSLLYLPFAIALSVLITKIPLLSEATQFLGRHTLEIYLGHQLALTLIFGFLVRRLPIEFNVGDSSIFNGAGFWGFACVLIGLFGGLMIAAVKRIPVVGWTVAPPPVAQHVERLALKLKSAPAEVPAGR